MHLCSLFKIISNTVLNKTTIVRTARISNFPLTKNRYNYDLSLEQSSDYW